LRRERSSTGKYLAVITELDMKPTKSSTGNDLYGDLFLTVQGIDGNQGNPKI